jgi:hypothetical protein
MDGEGKYRGITRWLVALLIMPDAVPMRPGVKVRVQVFGGNYLWMNLGWYRIRPIP